MRNLWSIHPTSILRCAIFLSLVGHGCQQLMQNSPPARSHGKLCLFVPFKSINRSHLRIHMFWRQANKYYGYALKRLLWPHDVSSVSNNWSSFHFHTCMRSSVFVTHWCITIKWMACVWRNVHICAIIIYVQSQTVIAQQQQNVAFSFADSVKMVDIGTAQPWNLHLIFIHINYHSGTLDWNGEQFVFICANSHRFICTRKQAQHSIIADERICASAIGKKWYQLRIHANDALMSAMRYQLPYCNIIFG